ncbi:hypothetical protein PCASD_19394 [Puccinia coronata f. sp. avenae]|uniref:Uncharacterized protein n=1 Tax=Puccinia coronata f. sp. avenae TaxID=200324 RepID=A0A2N5SMA2_9BASI|nr:hypothetical protein PCASD_19394 [Puccinia coronata f. sp. avenae]
MDATAQGTSSLSSCDCKLPHDTKSTTFSGALLLLHVFLAWHCVACLPLESEIGTARVVSSRNKPGTSLADSSDLTIHRTSGDLFSSSKMPLLHQENRESIGVTSGSERQKLENAYVAAASRSLNIKNAPTLAEEWEEEFTAGLNLIAHDRPAYAKKIQESLAFKSLPDYLNVLVGQQLESVKELGGRPVRGRGTLTEKDTWLKYWFAKTPGELDTTLKFPDAKQLSSSLRDNHNPEELEHLELLKFPGAQQLPSFLRDNHTPEELEHLELQVARMILNSKIRVFQLSKELTRDDFDKMVKNSQEIPVKVNGDLSELFHKNYAGQYSKERNYLLAKEEEFRKEAMEHLQRKLSGKWGGHTRATQVYLLMGKASQVHTKDQIQDAIERQAEMDNLLKRTLERKDRPAPPIDLIKLMANAAQVICKKLNRVPSEKIEMIPESPLRLSSLWNAKSHDDLDVFASQVQLFQNIIHRHLLNLFVNNGRWYSSNSYSCDRWFEEAETISNSDLIKTSAREFRRPFIEQLEDAKASFVQWRPPLEAKNK